MANDMVSELTTERLRVEVDGQIITVTAISPKTFNAQDKEMLLDLNHAFRSIESMEPLPRVLILTAEGPRFIGAAQPEYLDESRCRWRFLGQFDGAR